MTVYIAVTTVHKRYFSCYNTVPELGRPVAYVHDIMQPFAIQNGRL